MAFNLHKVRVAVSHLVGLLNNHLSDSDANDFKNAKSHAGKKLLLAGYILPKERQVKLFTL